MKILLVNGSANPKGNTATSLEVIAAELQKNGAETEIWQIGNEPLRDCCGCGGCRNGDGLCVFDDDQVNRFIETAKTCDGFIFATPVYYAHPSGRILSLLDRAFYGGSSKYFRGKPGASFAIARRAGTTASFDVLNKYFTIAEMPVVSSSYWNVAHGAVPGEVTQDEEGIQIMENLARNMVWLCKCIEAGKAAGIERPENSYTARSNFIR